MMYEEDDLLADIDLEFELLNSDDGKLITLVCTADKELSPDEYAQALKLYAERIEAIVTMTEVSGHILN